MKTYYVSIDCQGQTELIVKVNARSNDDAKYKALLACFAAKDISIIDKEIAKSCQADNVPIIDEEGEEIRLEEDE